MPSQDELLREIRENFTYAKAEWKEIYDEGRRDMRVVSGDPWPREARAERESNQRLCLSLDEVNQYLNQCINEVRQNKRAIKVSPRGNGATDETAELRAGTIRGIEYDCKAPASYIQAFSDMVQRSFGFWIARIDYQDHHSFDRVLRIEPVLNPESVLIDPDYKKLDGEDMDYGFELTTMPEKDFVRKWPDAEIRSFTPEHERQAPGWIISSGTGMRRIQVAGYWKRKKKKRTMMLMPDGQKAFLDQFPGAKLRPGEGNAGLLSMAGRIIQVPDWRRTEECTVCQYVTNGLEILEENDWPGSAVPIYPCFGKVLYVARDESSEPKRIILSLTRLARDPQLLYCFARTCQGEMAGMAPKIVWTGYEGQFSTNTPWETLNKTLVPYAEVKATTEGTGSAILPLPQMNQYEPPIQALETLAGSARLAIQSAMGIQGLISGRRGQNTSAKSGVALKELDEQQSQSTFHFTDALDRAIERTGRDFDEILGKVYDQPRSTTYVKKDETVSMIPLNQPGEHPETGKPMEFRTDVGEHGVAIGVGPSYDSQHDQASEFADTLVQNAAILGPAAPKILSLAIRLKNLGPLGDEMADTIAPPEDKDALPPEAQQLIAAGHKQIQDLEQQLEATLKELHDKQAELDLKKYIADQVEETKRTLGLAELDAQAAIVQLKEELGILRGRFDAAVQGLEANAAREHERQMAAQGHQQVMEQQQNAADLAPEPTQAGGAE